MSSEIRDKVEQQIIHILDVWHNFSKEDTEDIKWRRYFIEHILSIKEFAIVDREAELPHLPTTDLAHFAARTYRNIILKEGWVKEIKDDRDY